MSASFCINPDQAIANAGQFIDISHFRGFWAMETIIAQSPACRQGYVDETWALQNERLRVQDQIAPLAAADRRKPYDAAAMTDAQTQLGYFIRGRRTILTRDFPSP